MGNVTSNMMGLLKTDGPLVEYYTDMNTLYLILDMNSNCNRGQDFVSFTVVLTAYKNEELKESLSSWTRTYARHQLKILETPDDMRPYNIYIDMDNYHYELQIHFNFNSSGNSYESKKTTIPIDNTITEFASSRISYFFQGVLKDNMRRNKEFTVWVNDFKLGASYHLYDLVSNLTGTIIKQINDNGDGFIIVPAEINYQHVVRYLLNHKDLNSILMRYFDLVIPDDATFTFKFVLNAVEYRIHLKGNLQELNNIKN